jgi:hypothetical protein
MDVAERSTGASLLISRRSFCSAVAVLLQLLSRCGLELAKGLEPPTL